MLNIITEPVRPKGRKSAGFHFVPCGSEATRTTNGLTLSESTYLPIAGPTH